MRERPSRFIHRSRRTAFFLGILTLLALVAGSLAIVASVIALTGVMDVEPGGPVALLVVGLVLFTTGSLYLISVRVGDSETRASDSEDTLAYPGARSGSRKFTSGGYGVERRDHWGGSSSLRAATDREKVFRGLASLDEKKRIACARQLRSMWDSDAVEAAIKLLADPSSSVRGHALRALSAMVEGRKWLLPFLAGQLEHGRLDTVNVLRNLPEDLQESGNRRSRRCVQKSVAAEASSILRPALRKATSVETRVPILRAAAECGRYFRFYWKYDEQNSGEHGGRFFEKTPGGNINAYVPSMPDRCCGCGGTDDLVRHPNLLVTSVEYEDASTGRSTLYGQQRSTLIDVAVVVPLCAECDRTAPSPYMVARAFEMGGFSRVAASFRDPRFEAEMMENREWARSAEFTRFRGPGMWLLSRGCYVRRRPPLRGASS